MFAYRLINYAETYTVVIFKLEDMSSLINEVKHDRKSYGEGVGKLQSIDGLLQ